MLRQLGGSFGIAFMNTYVARQYSVHRVQLLNYVTSDNPIAMERLNQTAGAVAAKGVNALDAHQVGLSLLDNVVTRQAYVLTYLDAFRIVGIFFILVLPVMLLVKKNNVSAAAMKEAAEHAH
jgi:DHA2 family multidrug resistance protein